MVKCTILFATLLAYATAMPQDQAKSHKSANYVKYQKRLGVKPGRSPIILEQRSHILDCRIPPEFDSRQKWPECVNVIGNIRDQSACGSCWAVAAAGVFSDRKCISSSGAVQTSYSSEDTLSCCTLGGSEGCGGGWAESAWTWFTQTGVVSGGNFTNKDGCRPYLFCPPFAEWNCWTPNCKSTCDGTLPKQDYSSDKHHATSAFQITPRDVQSMQLEVLKNGSLEVSFTVYEDFFDYTGGVYQHNPRSPPVGGHAVRLIGWGIDNGLDYWLIANSWGYDWGEKGYFRIVRGVNECGIENDPVAGDVPSNP